tara:strand:+ start:309 stop:899 length:591 start_codon:yes stop_codon:yes gene_type:complete
MKKFDLKTLYQKEIQNHIQSTKLFLENNFIDFKKFFKLCIKSVNKGNKIILFGNGGSAADAQHIATELVVRYKKSRRSIPAISLATDTSALTAIGNDFSFNKIFSRQIESIGKKGDVAIGITTSGKSLNVLNALNLAKRKKIISVLLTKTNYPNKKKINSITDVVLKMPANETARIQELHILLGHLLCAALDESFS